MFMVKSGTISVGGRRKFREKVRAGRHVSIVVATTSVRIANLRNFSGLLKPCVSYGGDLRG